MSVARALVIEVRLPGGRFHGTRRADRSAAGLVDVSEWPPSPFRLFQALVAGAYGGRWAAESGEAAHAKDTAFAWLESLEPPIVAAPAAQAFSPVTYYVPNNDLDAMGGDPLLVSEIRVAKPVQAAVLAADRPLVYAWTLPEEAPHAHSLLRYADRLHTFGHGVDQAFATASLIDSRHLSALLEAHGGTVHRPSPAAGVAAAMPCPAPGSLASLKARHLGWQQRFRRVVDGRKVTTEFRQPAQPHARRVAYGAVTNRLLFELRDAVSSANFRPTPQTKAAQLVKAIRDLAFNQLANALPERREMFERSIVGRGSPSPDPRTRVRIVALPSIGMAHTSPSIRRVLVEVPADSPVSVGDLRWALAGRVFGGAADGDGVLSAQTVLAPAAAVAEADAMVGRYARPSALWRSVTPVVLPLVQPRPVATGAERSAQLEEAARSVAQALRHAGIEARPLAVRVQREPFRQRGRRVEDHAADRFGTERLHHLELRLDWPITGPLVLGDGRWLGLGLMEPVKEGPAVQHLFTIEGARPSADRAVEVSRALRRAVMSLAQAAIGAKQALPLFFGGHEKDGSPAASERHQHLFYVADDADGDGRIDRLAVVAAPIGPEADPTSKRQRARHLVTLGRALQSLTVLRAGPAGVLMLRAGFPPRGDAVFGSGRSWFSRTPYRPTRQPKADINAALQADVLRECSRRGLPAPIGVDVLDTARGRRGGMTAHLRIRFATAVAGPLLIGAEAHFGRCLFQLDLAGDDSWVGATLRGGEPTAAP